MDIIKYTDLKCINSKVSETILRKMPDNEFYKLKKDVYEQQRHKNFGKKLLRKLKNKRTPYSQNVHVPPIFIKCKIKK